MQRRAFVLRTRLPDRWIPMVLLAGRQTSPTSLEWRIDWHPRVEEIMTPEEWKTFNQHLEAVADLVRKASERPPKTKGD